ncbi:MAG: TraL conjugative transposon family protein [Bacteroidales bacterium]|jgi:hypothetical protein|nr:TraL conjugative transposon family protein [Bacteroidales bacterium]
MKDRLITQLRDMWGELTYGVRWLCLCPSPGKRLVTVLVLVVVFGGANIWFVTNSIYNMGKRDAEKKFFELQHIEPVELHLSKDSIHPIKNFKWEIIKNQN